MRINTIAAILLLVVGTCFSSRLNGAPLEWEFDIAGSPDIAGPAGSTIGWGYTITNLDPDNWLVLTAVDADLFQFAFPMVVFDFPIVPPNQVVTVPYDSVIQFGLYQITWDLFAPMGFVNSGTFILTADWYDDDPLSGGALLLSGTTESENYSATVGAIPEPAPALLTGPALLAGALIVRRLRQ